MYRGSAGEKPFDVFAERPKNGFSRGDRTPIELFLAGVAGWQTELAAGV
jgi:hypothetical protein